MPHPAFPASPLPSHKHSILICSQPQHWRQVAVAFLHDGLRAGERVVYLNDLYSEPQVRAAIRSKQGDAPQRWDDGQLLIRPVEDWLAPHGVFDPAWALGKIRQVAGEDRQAGLAKVRFLLDMNWGSYLSMGSRMVLECERMLSQYFLQRYRCQVLCHYEKVLFAPHILEALAECHQVVLGDLLRKPLATSVVWPRQEQHISGEAWAAHGT